ncbi:MAG: hypothetical protein AAF304_02640 [Pseudomonadota bacterium]
MQTKINYLLLFAVIMCGVVAGNLISHWIISEYKSKKNITKATEDAIHQPEPSSQIEETEEQAVDDKKTAPRETIKLSPEGTKESEVIEPVVNSDELIEQRKSDENGIRLAKQCSEWTVVHKDMQTKTSENGMNKYCDQYYDYISFGALPK